MRATSPTARSSFCPAAFCARKTGPSAEQGTVWVVGPGELAGELALVELAPGGRSPWWRWTRAEALILERDVFRRPRHASDPGSRGSSSFALAAESSG